MVYDPLMGRATTLIEAQLRGRRALGNDINPLSQVLAAPRLTHQQIEQIEERINCIQLPRSRTTDKDLLTFFAAKTLSELYSWRRYFREQRAKASFDSIDAWLEMVACNRLTGHSRGFFSVYTLPPNQATSIKRQKKLNQKQGLSPEYRDTKKLILKKSKSLLRDPLPNGYGDQAAQLLNHSADHTPMIPNESVQLVVTSPPFLNAVNYLNDNWMRNWFCKITPNRNKLWQLSSIEKWKSKMSNTLHELRRILKPDGHIAFEVGEIRKGSIRLEEQVVEAGFEAGLHPDHIIINRQKFTKTANCWGIQNNAAGTNSNRIVVFRK